MRGLLFMDIFRLPMRPNPFLPEAIMTDQTQTPEIPQLDENQIIALRREKLNEIRQQGIAFPNDFRRDAFAADLHAQYGEMSKEELDPQAVPVKIAGRMMLKRQMGKASFATVQDATGQIQLYLNNKGVSQEVLDAFNHWDMGDIIGVSTSRYCSETIKLRTAWMILLRLINTSRLSALAIKST